MQPVPPSVPHERGTSGTPLLAARRNSSNSTSTSQLSSAAASPESLKGKRREPAHLRRKKSKSLLQVSDSDEEHSSSSEQTRSERPARERVRHNTAKGSIRASRNDSDERVRTVSTKLASKPQTESPHYAEGLLCSGSVGSDTLPDLNVRMPPGQNSSASGQNAASLELENDFLRRKLASFEQQHRFMISALDREYNLKIKEQERQRSVLRAELDDVLKQLKLGQLECSDKLREADARVEEEQRKAAAAEKLQIQAQQQRNQLVKQVAALRAEISRRDSQSCFEVPSDIVEHAEANKPAPQLTSTSRQAMHANIAPFVPQDSQAARPATAGSNAQQRPSAAPSHEAGRPNDSLTRGHLALLRQHVKTLAQEKLALLQQVSALQRKADEAEHHAQGVDRLVAQLAVVRAEREAALTLSSNILIGTFQGSARSPHTGAARRSESSHKRPASQRGTPLLQGGNLGALEHPHSCTQPVPGAPIPRYAVAEPEERRDALRMQTALSQTGPTAVENEEAQVPLQHAVAGGDVDAGGEDVGALRRAADVAGRRAEEAEGQVALVRQQLAAVEAVVNDMRCKLDGAVLREAELLQRLESLHAAAAASSDAIVDAALEEESRRSPPSRRSFMSSAFSSSGTSSPPSSACTSSPATSTATISAGLPPTVNARMSAPCALPVVASHEMEREQDGAIDDFGAEEVVRASPRQDASAAEAGAVAEAVEYRMRVAELTEALARATAEDKQVRDAAERSASAAAALREELAAAQEELAAAQEELVKSREVAGRLRIQGEEQEEQARRLKAEGSALIGGLEAASRLAHALKQDMANEGDVIDGLRQDLYRLEASRGEQVAVANAASQEVAEELENCKARLAAEQARVADLEAELQQEARIKASADAATKDATDSRQLAAEMAEAATAAAERSESAAAALREELAAAQEELAAAQEELVKSREVVGRLHAQVEEQEEQARRLKAEGSALSDAVRNVHLLLTDLSHLSSEMADTRVDAEQTHRAQQMQHAHVSGELGSLTRGLALCADELGHFAVTAKGIQDKYLRQERDLQQATESLHRLQKVREEEAAARESSTQRAAEEEDRAAAVQEQVADLHRQRASLQSDLAAAIAARDAAAARGADALREVEALKQTIGQIAASLGDVAKRMSAAEPLDDEGEDGGVLLRLQLVETGVEGLMNQIAAARSHVVAKGGEDEEWDAHSRAASGSGRPWSGHSAGRPSSGILSSAQTPQVLGIEGKNVESTSSSPSIHFNLDDTRTAVSTRPLSASNLRPSSATRPPAGRRQRPASAHPAGGAKRAPDSALQAGDAENSAQQQPVAPGEWQQQEQEAEREEARLVGAEDGRVLVGAASAAGVAESGRPGSQHLAPTEDAHVPPGAHAQGVNKDPTNPAPGGLGMGDETHAVGQETPRVGRVTEVSGSLMMSDDEDTSDVSSTSVTESSQESMHAGRTPSASPPPVDYTSSCSDGSCPGTPTPIHDDDSESPSRSDAAYPGQPSNLKTLTGILVPGHDMGLGPTSRGAVPKLALGSLSSAGKSDASMEEGAAGLHGPRGMGSTSSVGARRGVGAVSQGALLSPDSGERSSNSSARLRSKGQGETPLRAMSASDGQVSSANETDEDKQGSVIDDYAGYEDDFVQEDHSGEADEFDMAIDQAISHRRDMRNVRPSSATERRAPTTASSTPLRGGPI